MFYSILILYLLSIATIMKGAIVLLCFLSAAAALHVMPSNRPLYKESPSSVAKSALGLGLNSDQRMDCYDSANGYGSSVHIGTSPVPDLNQSPYYFDNRIESCNFNGIYILYDGYNYNQGNLNVSSNSVSSKTVLNR